MSKLTVSKWDAWLAVGALGASVLLAACTARTGAFTASHAGGLGSPRTVNEGPYRLRTGDILDVRFPYQPAEDQRVAVRPDGKITLPSTGDLDAAGLTTGELEVVIRKKAAQTMRDPEVSVIVAKIAELRVYVGGEVYRPGFVELREGMTPLQAILERGGFTDRARVDSVVYISRSPGGAQTASRLDIDAVVSGDERETVTLKPDDIVYVPRTWIGNANIWVQQHIRGLLPTVPRPSFGL